jgi:hypothetical protein
VGDRSIDRAWRDELAVELRRSGMTYLAIAEAMGIGEATARRAVLGLDRRSKPAPVRSQNRLAGTYKGPRRADATRYELTTGASHGEERKTKFLKRRAVKATDADMSGCRQRTVSLGARAKCLLTKELTGYAVSRASREATPISATFSLYGGGSCRSSTVEKRRASVEKTTSPSRRASGAPMQ